jgi:nitric oxide reductase NorD protein
LKSLESSDNTRLGAAVRRATKLLGTQRNNRRTLLIQTDGKSNYIDRYQGLEWWLQLRQRGRDTVRDGIRIDQSMEGA